MLKFIPGWFTEKRKCHFCGTKLSVKYRIEIMDETTKEVKEVDCCNRCALTAKIHIGVR